MQQEGFETCKILSQSAMTKPKKGSAVDHRIIPERAELVARLRDLAERLPAPDAPDFADAFDQFDAYVWFEETRAATPLGPERPHGVPETWPLGV